MDAPSPDSPHSISAVMKIVVDRESLNFELCLMAQIMIFISIKVLFLPISLGMFLKVKPTVP